MKESLKRAQRKYQAEKTRTFSFRFNLGTDKDVIQKLDKQENKQGYIKALIRKDIKRDGV